MRYDQAGGADYSAAPQVVESVTRAEGEPDDHGDDARAGERGVAARASRWPRTAPGGVGHVLELAVPARTRARTFTMTSGTGTCSVRYDQAGSANYNAAPQVVESVSAQKAARRSRCRRMRRRARRSARASRWRRRRRAAPVTFSSAGACSNVGATFTMTSGTGTCSVMYDQAGSATFNAAPQVVETVSRREG